MVVDRIKYNKDQFSRGFSKLYIPVSPTKFYTRFYYYPKIAINTFAIVAFERGVEMKWSVS